MKKFKSVDIYKIADLFKEQPINKLSSCIGTVPGSSTCNDVTVIVIDIIIIVMLIGSIFILLK